MKHFIKNLIIIQAVFGALLNLYACQSEKGKNSNVVINDTIQKIENGMPPDTNTFLLILGAGFNKDSIKIFVDDKLFDDRKVTINYSIAVSEEEIPNEKKIHTIGISVNNSNIINIKIKPKIYVMSVNLDNTKKVFQISFMDKIPLID